MKKYILIAVVAISCTSKETSKQDLSHEANRINSEVTKLIEPIISERDKKLQSLILAGKSNEALSTGVYYSKKLDSIIVNTH